MAALTLDRIKAELPERGLFGGGTWLTSPEPFRLSRADVRSLRGLGHVLTKFQEACDAIYRGSAAGRLPRWIAEALDAGKPDWLIAVQHSAGLAGRVPRIIRPDLMLCADGLAMTEIDSVPGGIGMTACLARAYAKAGYDILGGPDGMIEGFRSLMPDGGAILISREAADYRPEMDWLAAALGPAWYTEEAEHWLPGNEAIYRFFEWFDWDAVPPARAIAEAQAAGSPWPVPPALPHLEEKLWLALLWTPSLRKIWERYLRGSHLRRLQEITPYGWMVDPEPLPPHAALPRLDAHGWEDVAEFSQHDRKLVLKISGFHETAWGSRGVYIGHDLPGEEWAARIRHALASSQDHPWIMQQFREGKRIEHPVFLPDGSVRTMAGRVRLCPYYFTDGTGITTLGGCLATIVPADKKKVHGMSDAVLVPCIEE